MATPRKRKCFERNGSQKFIRKVRVYFRDPYSTDMDSSDDEERSCYSKMTQSLRVVNSAVVSERSSHRRLKIRKPVLNLASIEEVRNTPVGVRQRKWGVQIRNPVTKSRTSLGTFPISEETAKAYEKKEFETLSWKKSLTIDFPKSPESSQYVLEAKCGVDFNNFFFIDDAGLISEMEIPYLRFNDEDFNREMDFGSMINEFGKFYDDYCGMEDLPECDFDFRLEEFAYIDDHQQTLINIPCT